MISFERLGYFGRLGNQMFQYAALVGFAKASNQSWGIPERNSNEIEIGGLGYKEKMNLNEVFNLDYEKEINPDKRFNENGSLVSLPENTDIMGYFQSEQYFNHCKDFVKEQFTFKSECVDKCQKYFKENNVDPNQYASVHVRRGDYVTLNGPILLSEDYYETSMRVLGDMKFMVFSDDIDWCKSNRLFSNENCIFPNLGLYEDLYMMTQCGANIVANSSLSWWGAWLGEDEGKKIIAPKVWSKGPENSYIVPDRWIRV